MKKEGKSVNMEICEGTVRERGVDDGGGGGRAVKLRWITQRSRLMAQHNIPSTHWTHPNRPLGGNGQQI